MSQASIPPTSEKLRKAISWISEETLARPDKARKKILKEAELRFDLAPLECEFLDQKFGDESAKTND